eukprot:403369562
MQIANLNINQLNINSQFGKTMEQSYASTQYLGDQNVQEQNSKSRQYQLPFFYQYPINLTQSGLESQERQHLNQPHQQEQRKLQQTKFQSYQAESFPLPKRKRPISAYLNSKSNLARSQSAQRLTTQNQILSETTTVQQEPLQEQNNTDALDLEQQIQNTNDQKEKMSSNEYKQPTQEQQLHYLQGNTEKQKVLSEYLQRIVKSGKEFEKNFKRKPFSAQKRVMFKNNNEDNMTIQEVSPQLQKQNPYTSNANYSIYKQLKLNLSGKSINERNFDTLIQALTMSNCRLAILNVSYNSFFKDSCLQNLIQYIEKKSLDLISSECKAIFDNPVIKEINIEKTGVTDKSIKSLIKILPLIGLRSLNLSSNNLTQVGDKLAIQLIDACLFVTNISELNLAQNGLGFKTSQFIINQLQPICNKQYCNNTLIENINLEFNVMSDSMIKRIKDLLSRLAYLRTDENLNYKDQLNAQKPKYLIQKDDYQSLMHDRPQTVTSSNTPSLKEQIMQRKAHLKLNQDSSQKNLDQHYNYQLENGQDTSLSRDNGQIISFKTPQKQTKMLKRERSSSAQNKSFTSVSNSCKFIQKHNLKASSNNKNTKKQQYKSLYQQKLEQQNQSVDLFNNENIYTNLNPQNSTAQIEKENQKLIQVRKNLSKVLQSKLSRGVQQSVDVPVIMQNSFQSDAYNQNSNGGRNSQFQTRSSYDSQNNSALKEVSQVYLNSYIKSGYKNISQDLRNSSLGMKIIDNDRSIMNTEEESLIDLLIQENGGSISQVKAYLQQETEKYQRLIMKVEEQEQNVQQKQEVQQLVNNLKFLKKQLYHSHSCQNSSGKRDMRNNIENNLIPESTAQFSISAMAKIDEDELEQKLSFRNPLNNLQNIKQI